MKNMLPALITYVIVCIITLFLPASDGYNSIGWKFIVAQMYAIPAVLIVSMITSYLRTKKG